MAASQPRIGPPLQPGRWVFDLVAVLLPLAIAALGVFLLISHRRAWRAARTAATDPRELRFQRRRYLRRMQTSGMLVVLGAALGGGQAIAADKQPSLFVYFWCAVAILAVWVMVLAFTDVVATRLHLAGQIREQIVERARLQAELERIKAERKDTGRPPGDQ